MFTPSNLEKDIDKIMGTPSAHKIVRFLTIWDSISFQNLGEFTDLSSSQIQATLNNLIDLGLVERLSKGVYHLTPSNFSENLIAAYTTFHLQWIGYKLSSINRLINENKLQESYHELELLTARYRPFLDKYFTHQLSNISHAVLDQLQHS